MTVGEKRPNRSAPLWGNAKLLSRKTLRFILFDFVRDWANKNERAKGKGR